MDAADDLKPCPFCGGAAERFDIPEDEDDPNSGGSCIQCSRCDASTGLHFDRKENLVSSWNDRVADAELRHVRAVAWQAQADGAMVNPADLAMPCAALPHP